MPLCNRPSGIYIFPFFSLKTSPGWFIFDLFFWLIFFLSCVTPKKARRGGNSYNFINMKPLKTFYILLWREELKGLDFLCEIVYMYPVPQW